jgi:hypothetical protein
VFVRIGRVVVGWRVFFGSTTLGTGMAPNLFGRAPRPLQRVVEGVDNSANLRGLRTGLSAALETVDRRSSLRAGRGALRRRSQGWMAQLLSVSAYDDHGGTNRHP